MPGTHLLTFATEAIIYTARTVLKCLTLEFSMSLHVGLMGQLSCGTGQH